MEIFGVPLHPLVVHAAVVLIPLVALGTLIVAFWPRALRRFGLVLAVLAAGGLGGSIIASESGEELFESLGEQASSTLNRHMELGTWVWVPTLVMTVALLALLLVWLRKSDETPGWVYWSAVVVAVVAAVAALVLVILVGHSGATAVWTE